MDTTMPQSMAQAPFYFFQEASKDVRKHQSKLYSMVPTMPTTPVYSRPGSSSCSQPPTLYSNGPSVMTPTGSPQPVSNVKPSIMLETDLGDNPYFPSTPPLSTSGSTVGSPKSGDVLQTPMNPMFSGLEDAESLKGSFEPVEAAALDWSTSGSPPMTPVYLQSLTGNAASFNASCGNAFGAATSASYAKSVSSEQDVDFCDPRNLTVSANAANPTLAPEFSVNPLGEELVKRESAQITAGTIQPAFDFNPALPHGLPTFEELSDLESEDDFVNSFVNLGEQDNETGRPRACTGSSIVSLGHASFIGDEDLSFEENSGYSFPSLPSPPSTNVSFSEDSHKDKRVKKSHKKDDRVIAPVMSAAAADEATPSNEQESPSNDVNDSGSETNGSSGSENGSAPLPAPVNRRGRKQSLTEDPSKTFVCDLCHRRFRRQEHLKRHYRSLHTQEKPFECNECGKKFSRSDNLAQHARTHGSGAIVMNLIEEGETSVFDGSVMAPTADDYGTYGKVLFQIASEVPGSASELSSEENSDQGKKKRKRSE